MTDVLSAKAAVDDVSIFVHGGHILLNVRRIGSQGGDVGLQIDREGLRLGPLRLLLGFGFPTGLLVFETSASHLG